MTLIEWIENNPTLAIAVYGAFVSTIAVGWNIYKYLQDKPKVKVTAKFGFTHSEAGASEHLLIVTAVNSGKKPVYLSSMGLRSGEEDLLNLHTHGLPCELKSGCSHSEWFKAKELKNRQFNFAWYRDATEKLYKSKDLSKKLDNYFKRDIAK